MLLPELTLFLDENLHNNRLVLRLLEAESVCVERFGSHFTRGTEDSVWLPLLRDRGWTLLTADKRIRFRFLERRAVQENALRVFCFTSNEAAPVLMNALRICLPRMRKIAEQQPPPFIATISQAGHVEVRESFGAEIVALR